MIFCRPQLEIILADLRERLDRGDTTLIAVDFGAAKNWEDNPDVQWIEPPLCAFEENLYPKLVALHTHFTSDEYLPRNEVRRGDTVAAVVDSLHQLDGMDVAPDTFGDMASAESITANYPLPVRRGPKRNDGYGGVVTSRASAESFDKGERIVLGEDEGFQGTHMEASRVQVGFDLDEIQRIVTARICLDINAYNIPAGVLKRDVSVIVNGKKHVFIKSQTRQTSLLGEAKICDWDGLSCFDIPSDYLVTGRNTIRLEAGGASDGGDEVLIATDRRGRPVLRLVLELPAKQK